MHARWVMLALAIVFIVLAVVRIVRDGGTVAAAPRIWLLTGAIFGAVSLYLWLTAR